MKRILIPTAVAGLLLATGAAEAATATANMTVQMIVAATCTVTANPLNFPDQSAGTTVEVLGAGTISVTCSNGAGYTVGMNAGANDGGGGITARKMKIGTGETISYQLYRDSGRSQVWGFTTTGSPDVYSDEGDGTAKTINVYGKVPSGQTITKVGTYTDTVTVTVNY